MSEMALTAEHLIIIGRGRLLADTTMERFVREAGTDGVTVVTPEPGRLHGLLAGPGVEITDSATGVLHVIGVGARQVGLTAAAHGIPLFELTPRTASLEQAFMELTRDAVEYHGTTGPREARKTGAAA
jgi:ABC-2 type transport system ATP-binding protein